MGRLTPFVVILIVFTGLFLSGSAQNGGGRPLLLIYLDRPFYEPGDTILLRGSLVDSDGRPVANAEILVSLTDSAGSQLVQVQVETDDRGWFSLNYTLSDQAPEGYYSVEALDMSFSLESASLVFPVCRGCILDGGVVTRTVTMAERTVTVVSTITDTVTYTTAVGEKTTTIIVTTPVILGNATAIKYVTTTVTATTQLTTTELSEVVKTIQITTKEFSEVVQTISVEVKVTETSTTTVYSESAASSFSNILLPIGLMVGGLGIGVFSYYRFRKTPTPSHPSAKPEKTHRSSEVTVLSRGSDMICPSCGSSNKIGSSQCSTCGQPFPIVGGEKSCPVCGADLRRAVRVNSNRLVCGICFSDILIKG